MKYKFCSLFLVVIYLLSTSAVSADSSNISGLVFTNQEQVVKPGEVSGEIKVQTQNSSGVSESVSETNDVIFTSTSPTGEFLNSSGNVVTKTMSKNTSSRTFYYKDSTLGVFDITVTITGRESGVVFVATQSITISNSVDTGGGDTSTTATTTSSTSNSQTLSAHSSTQTITYVVQKVAPKADAGRYRLTTTNSPVEFDAVLEGFDDGLRASYEWSFGDGKLDEGKLVKHLYKFSGSYVVILNVHSNNHDAVSRTEVTVVDPDIHITNTQPGADGYIELTNNSEYEVNIQDWGVKDSYHELFFPKDTIVKSKTSIKFPFESNGEVAFLYPDGTLVDDMKPLAIADVAYSEPTREEIELAKVKVAQQFALEKRRLSSVNALNSETLNTEISNSGLSIVDDEVSVSETEPTSIIDSLDTEEKSDDSSFLAAPVRMFSFIKNFLTK